jgi:hypothetical protein
LPAASAPTDRDRTAPVLVHDASVELGIDRAPLGRALVRFGRPTAFIQDRVQVQVCDATPVHSVCAPPASVETPPGAVTGTCEPRNRDVCANDAIEVFDGYRTLLPRGEDVRFPRQSLAYSTDGSRLDSFVLDVSIAPTCLPIVAIAGAIIGSVTGAVLTPGPLCEWIRATVARQVLDALGDVVSARLALGTLAAKPPSFRLSLRDLVLARLPESERDRERLRARAVYGELAALFDSAGLDPSLATAAAYLFGSYYLDSVFVSIEASASLPDEPGTPVAATNAHGALKDGFVRALALGGDIDGQSVTLDLRTVKRACSRGLATGVIVDLDLCRFCSGPRATPVLCDGDTLRETVGPFALPPGALSLTAAGTPSPVLASVLDTTYAVAEVLRAVTARPLGLRGVYARAATRPGSDGSVEAVFDILDDPDADGLDDAVDNCPDVPNRDQRDDDADGIGDACDRCLGIPTGAAGNVDSDGDGLGNGCDCDADGDGCNNAGTGPDGVPCATSDALSRFDPRPTSPGTRDFDGDGRTDECDLDEDDDGAELDPEGTGLDNCPFGDGDDVFEPGAAADQNPDQTDSGGLPGVGDLCDPGCRFPGDRFCTVAPGAGGADTPRGAGVFGPGLIAAPGRADCLGRLCFVGAFAECTGGEVDRCASFGFDRLRLRSAGGQVVATLDAEQLGVPGLAANLLEVPDLDGDGRPDFAVGAPGVGPCLEGLGGELACAGAVLFVGSSSLAVVDRLVFGAGERAGLALARAGADLYVGVPGATGGGSDEVRGAVHVFRIAEGALAYRRTLVGDRAGERFGAALAALPGQDRRRPWRCSRPARPAARCGCATRCVACTRGRSSAASAARRCGRWRPCRGPGPAAACSSSARRTRRRAPARWRSSMLRGRSSRPASGARSPGSEAAA